MSGLEEHLLPQCSVFAALPLGGGVLGLSLLRIKQGNLILLSCLHSKTWYEIPAYV